MSDSTTENPLLEDLERYRRLKAHTVQTASPTIDPLLRLPDVRRLTGLARSTIYARVADGSFPAPRRLGPRCVAWSESEIAAWIASRPLASTAPAK